MDLRECSKQVKNWRAVPNLLLRFAYPEEQVSNEYNRDKKFAARDRRGDPSQDADLEIGEP